MATEPAGSADGRLGGRNSDRNGDRCHTSRLGAELAALVTEAVRPGFARIDELPAAELAALMVAEDAKVPLAVAGCLPQIAAAVDAIEDRMRQGGRLI